MMISSKSKPRQDMIVQTLLSFWSKTIWIKNPLSFGTQLWEKWKSKKNLMRLWFTIYLKSLTKVNWHLWDAEFYVSCSTFYWLSTNSQIHKFSLIDRNSYSIIAWDLFNCLKMSLLVITLQPIWSLQNSLIQCFRF